MLPTQAIVSGLMSGALYALLAVGLIIAWQTTRVVNLAHGESYAVGGLAAAGLSQAGLPAWAALPGGVVAAMVFGWATERFLLRPRKDWPAASLILVTLATAFLSRGVLYLAAGVDPLSFPRLLGGRPIRMLQAAWPRQGLALIAVGLVASIAVTLFLQATEAGRRLRATAENPDAAQLLGIDTDRARATAFVIAGGLGGLGAVLLVPLVSVDYQAGLGMTLRGFIAAALAGMSAPRAVLAGLALGLAESLVTWWFGALAQDPIVFLALILVALWQSRHIRFGGSARA
jgi:branched-chain amino acid transport system permease protein